MAARHVFSIAMFASHAHMPQAKLALCDAESIANVQSWSKAWEMRSKQRSTTPMSKVTVDLQSSQGCAEEVALCQRQLQLAPV